MIKILVIDVGVIFSSLLNFTYIHSPNYQYDHANYVYHAFIQTLKPSLYNKISYDVCGQSYVLTSHILVNCISHAINNNYHYVLIPYNGSNHFSPAEEKIFNALSGKPITVVMATGNYNHNLFSIYPQRFCLQLTNCILVSASDVETSPKIKNITIDLDSYVCINIFLCSRGSSYSAPKHLATLINNSYATPTTRQ